MAAAGTTGSETRLDTISRLARLAQLTEATLQRTVRAHGLTIAEQTVLTTLRLNGPPYRQSPGDLGRVLLQTSGGVTATIHRLERAGLVERVPDPWDRRRRLVQLSATGLKVEQRVFSDIEDHTKRLLDRVPPESQAVVTEVVALLLDLFETETADATGVAARAR